jgi:C4-dicarboxylate-specific signal transduction histidine kinase
MNADSDRERLNGKLLPYCLAFSGKITASVTHELNNVLGTIDQVNGLIEDMVEVGGSGQNAQSEKLRNVSDKIVRQIERGSRLIEKLNKFAHMSDSWHGDCDLKEMVTNITALSERLGRMHKIELATSFQDEDMTITTNPFFMAQLYFTIVFASIDIATEGTTIDVRCDRTENAARIEISLHCAEDVKQVSTDTGIQLLAGVLAAEVDESYVDGIRKVTVLCSHTQ